MLCLAYAGPLAVVPLLTARADRDLKWHVAQGVTLSALVTALAFIPYVACFALAAWPLVAVAAAASAVRGRRVVLPLLGAVASRWSP
jgi:uncharacterized membrane protein